MDRIRDIRLWFNRSSTASGVPEVLAPYITGKHFLSTKQAPSALALRKAGSASVGRERPIMEKAGFPLDHYTPGERYSPAARLSESISEDDGGSSSRLLRDERSYEDAYSDSYDSPGCAEPLSQDISDYVPAGTSDGSLPLPTKRLVRVKYGDPWKIHAGLVLAEAMGRPLPQVISWNGDGHRIQDQLSPNLFGKDFAAQVRNRIHFWDVKDPLAKSYFLRNHTHWGHALWTYAHDKTSVYHSFSCNLKRRILRFLSGKPDVIIPKVIREQLFVNPDELRDTKTRALRFVEMLKTLDGIFLQRYLVYPEEAWDWEKFDLFMLQGISLLIGDEFLDGEVTATGLGLTTSYSSLKKTRKLFKMHAHRGTLKQFSHTFLESKSWENVFLGQLYERVSKLGGTRQIFAIGILSQTRGAGRPPPLVTLRSKADFIRTVSVEPKAMSQTRRQIILAALGKTLEDLPQEAFTGLATKARVTVASSACWERTRKEGGTIEAVREALLKYSIDDPVPVRNLETGAIDCHKGPSGFETVGEFVFWASLDTILRTPRDDLRYIFLTVVQEPGKARTVTKGHACLKIVLDVVNKICSWPLKKGIESSTSGMGRSHHAWNYFIRMMSDEMKQDLFTVKERQEEEFEGFVERTDIFEDFFVSSTDYKEATDGMLHEFAKPAGNYWMLKCGIPPVLRGIVNMACYGPRTVVFTGTGGLSDLGDASPLGENLREVKLVRGIPMGDPLTKIVLHMSNIIARSIGESLGNPTFYDSFDNRNQALEAYRKGLDTPPV
jgi:hypothetical protein